MRPWRWRPPRGARLEHPMRTCTVPKGARAAGMLIASLALGGCSAALFDPRGPVGQAEKTILLDSLAIMLAIVVPTIVGALAVAWWFRATNTKARYLPDWEFSGRI